MDIEVEIANQDFTDPIGEAYNLVLKEKNGERFVPVVIGRNEATCILMELNQIAIPRPMPYDLIMILLQQFNAEVTGVRVHHLKKGIFYVHILITNAEGNWALESRISDAVVIALKAGVPICFAEEVFEAACYTKSGKFKGKRVKKPSELWDDLRRDDEGEVDSFKLDDGGSVPFDLTQAPTQQLKQLLHQAEENENFELAAEVDEELKRREDGE